jgi:hypothetical protein
MKKEGIPFDGFGSVVEMLRRSDSAFREKIMGGLWRRDPSLAQRLERYLGSSAREEDSRAALERGQRAAYTRNYGQ